MIVASLSGYLSHDVVFSVFSGSVAQSLALRLLGRPELHGARPKPFTVWPLLVDGRPVWDWGTAGAGSTVEVRAAFFEERLGEEFVKAAVNVQRIPLFNAEVVLESVEYKRVVPSPRSSQAFKVEFLSPARFETPPYVKRPVPVFDLTPRPLNLFKSAVKTAIRLGLADVRWARRFLRWAYASVGIVDFGCDVKILHGGRWRDQQREPNRRGRTCTASVRLSGGRELRGFAGWAVYRAFETSMVEDMWRMLSIAEAFGVGSNRPLGFGAVKITPLQ